MEQFIKIPAGTEMACAICTEPFMVNETGLPICSSHYTGTERENTIREVTDMLTPLISRYTEVINNVTLAINAYLEEDAKIRTRIEERLFQLKFPASETVEEEKTL